jgi:hypothetical protein
MEACRSRSGGSEQNQSINADETKEDFDDGTGIYGAKSIIRRERIRATDLVTHQLSSAMSVRIHPQRWGIPDKRNCSEALDYR